MTTPLFMPCRPIVVFVLSVLMAAAATAAPKIENTKYAVTADPATGSISIFDKSSGRKFATSGTAGKPVGTPSIVPLANERFGEGSGIVLKHSDGSSETIALYKDLPFVLFSSSIHNGTKEAVVLNKVPGMSVRLELGTDQNALMTLGTGGLLKPPMNPGSYSVLAVVDPVSRSGVVGGWVSQNRASGVVFSPVKDGAVCLEARCEYGRLRLNPGADAEGETFALGWFEDTRLGLETYADAVARNYGVRLREHKPGHCTWYMEKYSAACDEKHLAELAEYAEKNLKPYGLDFLQIDDHWQSGVSTNGPLRNFMESKPNGPYPSGMKATAGMIAGHGFTPGLWFIPFAGTYSDPFFHAHPEWFVKTLKEEPYEVGWGGTCLDMTQPDARAYLEGLVKRVVHEWGFKVLKLDGFWTGSGTKLTYVNNGYIEDDMGDAVFSDPSKPNIEAMRDGVKLIRNAAGPDVFLLGCCLSQNMRSLAGSIALVDSMRVGPDTGSGQIGALQASRLWFLNGRVWWNDPDCVSVRSSVSVDQARLNASFAAISGGMFLNSDWLPDLTPDRLDILRRCMPLHDLPSRPVDVFVKEPASVWHLEDTRTAPRRDEIALFNWGKKRETITTTAEKAGLPQAGEYVGFDYWAGKFVPPFHDTIGGWMPGKSARVLAIRPCSSVPQLISTSRHITQGMVDVTGEKWDPSAHTLRGTSQVVGNDPDELRIVVPAGDASWLITGITLSAEDAAAGVLSDFKQDGPKIWVTLRSPRSRSVRWEAAFKQAAVHPAAPRPIAGFKGEGTYNGVNLSWAENGSDRYRIKRNDGLIFETTEPHFDDTEIDPSLSYSYTVAALGWDGSEGAPVAISSQKSLRPPADPPLPTVPLDSLKPVSVKTARGTVSAGKNWQGKMLRINGKSYADGIGVCSPSTVVYAVPPGAKRFVAVVGIDEMTKKNDQMNLTFEIRGDVKEMGEAPEVIASSPVISKTAMPYWSFDVPLNSRFREIQLSVTAHDGQHVPADWVNAGFNPKSP